MSDSRVKLADIPVLTLHNDEPTLSRRGQSIPQLVCKGTGKSCSLFKPDVIRCTNLGGEGTNVDWKCETDLPESLRLGRVQVSCEGWSGPGDSYVLRGSCSLEYRLQEVPDVLRPSANHLKPPVRLSTSNILIICLCTGVLAYILYKFLLPCCKDGRVGVPRRTPRTGPSLGSGWSPGSGQQRNPEPQPMRYVWDNEYEHLNSRRDPDPQSPRARSAFSEQQSWSSSSKSGSSGDMNLRTSTGYGGSTVR